MITAALRLDALSVRDLVTGSIARDGVVLTWDKLVRPVFHDITLRQGHSGKFIDVEHLLSQGVTEALANVPRPSAGGPARALLSCAEDEQHTLPMDALSAALAERDIASINLGARLPTAALCDAARRTGPALAVIWSHAAVTADPGQLVTLARMSIRPLMIAAVGPGWSAPLPPGVWSPRSLAGAVRLAASIVAT
ncbi:hypothetical protein [Catellatospora methionotrophica]|uniref:hypothetical protein n=1 Tax=Catellatospora methionotrophica TaxID=121620 RepID=UPI0033FDF794